LALVENSIFLNPFSGQVNTGAQTRDLGFSVQSGIVPDNISVAMNTGVDITLKATRNSLQNFVAFTFSPFHIPMIFFFMLVAKFLFTILALTCSPMMVEVLAWRRTQKSCRMTPFLDVGRFAEGTNVPQRNRRVVAFFN